MREPHKRGSRQQVALEYLIVYGIAFLIIVVAVAFLFGIFKSPSSRIPNTCTFSGGVTCTDLVLASNNINGKISVMVLLSNAGDKPILSPRMKVGINGVNTSFSNCLPGYVKAGGAIVCIINVSTGKPGVNQLLSGKVYLSEQNCAFSSTGTCQNPLTQVYAGGFEGTTQANQTLRFQITLGSLEATINNITVGNGPVYVAFNSQGTLAYVINSGGPGSSPMGSVSIINTASGMVINTINIGAGYKPSWIALAPSGTLAYVTDTGVNTVSVIDTSTYTVTRTIGVGQNPYSVTFNPQGTLAYVTNDNTNTVSVISLATNSVVNTIYVSSNSFSSPLTVTFNPQGTVAYVNNLATGTIAAINGATNTVNSIVVGLAPYTPTFNPSGTLAYVPNAGSGTVSVIDTSKNKTVNTINVGLTPSAVAFNPSGTLAYVLNGGTNTVSVVNTATNTVVNTILVSANLDSSPRNIVLNPSGTFAYVTNYASSTVSIINTATNAVSTISVGRGTSPSDIVLNPTGTLAYIALSNSNVISVLHTGIVGPPASPDKYPIVATLSLSGIAIKGATINFSVSNPIFQVSPKYVPTNSTGQAVSYVWGSAPAVLEVYANFTNTISANMVLGLK